MSDRDAHFVVIVPTYDEADNLPRIVPRILEQDPRIDVLVVTMIRLTAPVTLRTV